MRFTPWKLLKSFRFAYKGIGFTLRSQQNFRFHLMVTIMVVIAGLMLKVSGIEWSILIGFIALVLSLELVNTSIEKLVDLISPDYHQQAGLVKDISAGAVLIAAIAAVIAGLTIFLPKVV